MWGPSFPGQSLPLPSPAPGRHPGPPAAEGVQCRAAPGGWCPRQQRSTLCGRGWSSAGASLGAEMAWASWSWMPCTCSWGNLKTFLYPRQERERLCLFNSNRKVSCFSKSRLWGSHGLRGGDGVRDEHHQCHHWRDEEPLLSTTSKHSCWDERLPALFHLHVKISYYVLLKY